MENPHFSHLCLQTWLGLGVNYIYTALGTARPWCCCTSWGIMYPRGIQNTHLNQAVRLSSLFRPLLLTPEQDAQMPKAELNISLTAPLQAQQSTSGYPELQFPKAGGFFSSTTKTLCRACISKQKEQFIHDGESWLSHSLSLSQRVKMLGMFSGKRGKKKKNNTTRQRDKRSQNLSG